MLKQLPISLNLSVVRAIMCHGYLTLIREFMNSDILEKSTKGVVSPVLSSQKNVFESMELSK